MCHSIVGGFGQPLVDKSPALTVLCVGSFLWLRNCLGISWNYFILKVKALAGSAQGAFPSVIVQLMFDTLLCLGTPEIWLSAAFKRHKTRKCHAGCLFPLLLWSSCGCFLKSLWLISRSFVLLCGRGHRKALGLSNRTL